MNLKIEFNDLKFRAAMKEAAVKLRANGPELVKEEARLFIAEYMKRTPPFIKGNYGKSVGSKADLEAGKAVIKGDLKQVAGFGERGFLQFVADTFGTVQVKQQLFKKGSSKPFLIDWDKVAFNIGELAKHHRAKMNKYGRPPGRQKGAGGKGQGDNTIGRWVAKEKVVVPSDVYFGYLKQLYDAIGSAKASFNAAAFALGMKRIPPWVRRHGNFGSYSEQGDPSNFSVIIGGQSKVPGAQRAVDEAIAVRATKFKSEMKRILTTFKNTGKIVSRRKSLNS
jgi:hypothetical protein